MATSSGNSGAAGKTQPGVGEPVPAQPMQAAVPMAKRGMIYTATAAQGFDSAQLINAAMANKHVGKATPRRIVVAEPDGPSTSGGKHARQVITLAPVEGQGGTVMCGWLDLAKKTAGLRDFRSVADQYRGRYGAAIDITAEDYLGIVRELEGLMKTIGVVASHEVSEPAKQAAKVAEQIAAPDGPEPEGAGMKALTLVLASVLLVGAVAAVVWLMR